MEITPKTVATALSTAALAAAALFALEPVTTAAAATPEPQVATATVHSDSVRPMFCPTLCVI